MNTTSAASALGGGHGLTVEEIHHNLSAIALCEHAIRYEKTFETYAKGASVGVKATAPLQ